MHSEAKIDGAQINNLLKKAPHQLINNYCHLKDIKCNQNMSNLIFDNLSIDISFHPPLVQSILAGKIDLKMHEKQYYFSCIFRSIFPNNFD